MRRLSLGLPLLMVIVLAGCKRQPKEPAEAPKQDAPLLSVVGAGDPAGSVQLAEGFFEIEANTWRWTAPKFTAVLRPPAGAAEKGARLELHLTLPAVVVDKTGPVSVSAEIGGRMLMPEQYSKTGDYIYTRDVDASLLRASVVTIHFATDKFLQPRAPESRELALIVTSVGLIAQ
jgi:hypothetical protein